VAVASCPHPIDAPDAGVPAELRAYVEEETRAAHERGLRLGREQGAAEARAADGRLPDAVRGAVADALAMLDDHRRRDAAEVLELALEIARHVVGREPGAEAAAVADHVRRSLVDLDDAPLVLAANPAQVEAVAAELAGDRIQVVPDPSIGPGEAVVRGPWSTADLRWEARWSVVREALGLRADGPRAAPSAAPPPAVEPA
jgi:flagellar biosynthesis/type III secretory pathway protein FliH